MSPPFERGRKIVVLCEGDTEELAVRHFIARRWKMDGLAHIALRTINLSGKCQNVGKYGNRYLDEPEVVGVFSIIDLQGMPFVRHEPHEELARKVERTRAWLRRTVTHARSQDFFPHVSVHQTEAWILAEGAALARRLNDPGIKPDPYAESKNFQHPPSERLNEMFLNRRATRYQKIIHGRSLFAAMEFEPVYGSCAYFKAFYDDLKLAASR